MDIPYTVTARPDTGLWNGKLGIWLFLASEIMLFGALFTAYLFERLGAEDGTWPNHVQNIWLGLTNTIILIISSITMVYAWVALKERNLWKFRGFLFATLAFVLDEGFEAAESFGGFLAERLLTEHAMAVRARHREGLFGIGRLA